MQFYVPLTVVVAAESIGHVDDEQLADALMGIAEVESVVGGNPVDVHESPTPLQMLKVGEQLRGRGGNAEVFTRPFDLPDGYVVANFNGGQTVQGGFTLGISPEGEGSS